MLRKELCEKYFLKILHCPYGQQLMAEIMTTDIVAVQ